jgi:hypothetical protein
MFKVCNWFNSQSKRQHWAKWLRYLSINYHSLEYHPIIFVSYLWLQSDLYGSLLLFMHLWNDIIPPPKKKGY